MRLFFIPKSFGHTALFTFVEISTDNDCYSGHGYSGIDRFSETKPPDDTILFTVSGMPVIADKIFKKSELFIL